MDIENLSYDYIKKFFDMYFDKDQLNYHYFCKECRTMKDLNTLDCDGFEAELFLNAIVDIDGDYICKTHSNYCKKNVLFNKDLSQCNEKNIEDLSDNEIINIMNKYINEDVYDLEYFYCKICKIIRVISFHDEEIIIKDGIKYLSGCGRCYITYPECCIDYYQFPLGENEYDICIDCYNETNPVNLKPAK
jgi:hypothetical protein